MVIILKSRDPHKHWGSRGFLQDVLWRHLTDNVHPRGGMFLGNANEVSVDTETGIYTIQWYDTVVGEYQG